MKNKQSLLYKLICIFSVFLFAVLLVPTHSQAQEPTEVSTLESPSPTPVDYLLPYPGVLPGNPLYTLKVLRDRIVWFLISNPLKKAEFDLLQADKRLSSGQYLFMANPKNTKDITAVISKGENYFGEAITEAELAAKQGQDPSSLYHRMLLSSEKHVEVLHALELQTKGELQNSLKENEQKVQRFEKVVYDTINKQQ